MNKQKNTRRGSRGRSDTRNTDRPAQKLPEPTVCPECGLYYHEGRWVVGMAPAHAHEHLCPACTRANNDDPAGFVEIRGEFFREHEDEILSLIEHVEERESSEHPLNRIIDQETTPDGLTVTTTDIRLAHAIGNALHHAYQGTLESQTSKDKEPVTIIWQK